METQLGENHKTLFIKFVSTNLQQTPICNNLCRHQPAGDTNPLVEHQLNQWEPTHKIIVHRHQPVGDTNPLPCSTLATLKRFVISSLLQNTSPTCFILYVIKLISSSLLPRYRTNLIIYVLLTFLTPHFSPKQNRFRDFIYTTHVLMDFSTKINPWGRLQLPRNQAPNILHKTGF
jgi:hypothetical protein